MQAILIDADSSHGRHLPTPSQLPSVLTLKELATELRCSKAHLSHIINGKVAGLPPLPVARIGRRVVIRREALLKWLWTVEGRNETIDADLNSPFLAHGKE
jgi:hypothetical protein